MGSGANGEVATPDFGAVLSRAEARNIAVTGSSAADKRKVVDGWRTTHGAERWMIVETPHFTGDAAPVSSADAEDALINQIACQMDPAKSPKSRLRPLMRRNGKLDAVVGIVAAAFVALTIFLAWVAGQLPSQRPATALCVLAFVAWLACIAFGVYHIARCDLFGRLASRIRRRKGGDGVEAGTGASPLERCMGELVYLFDSNDYDFVVFEGLDTYRYLPLFERLRALNTLANARRGAGREPLRFFYFVNDSLFADPHERAAFFDHIVPVIPFVEATDVLARFEEQLEEAGLEADAGFLADLSRFVDDPNILRAIVDETGHYKSGLLDGGGSEPGDLERLIALMTYKALFPRDFDLLQDGRGYVNALLESRDAIVEELQSRNLQASSGLAAEMKEAREAGDDDRLAALQDELDAIRRADLEFGRMPLSALIGRMANSDPFYSNPPCHDGLDPVQLHSVTSSPYFPFLRFAVGEGWIDATYERFLKNFYTETLVSDDRGLIAAVSQGIPVEEDRVVRNPYAVVSRLDANAFSLESARVFALLGHLLASGPSDKLKALFDGIDHDDDLAWLVRYAESSSFDPTVFAAAEEVLDRPLARIVDDVRIDVADRRSFCHRLLAFGRDLLADDDLNHAVSAFAHADARFLAVEGIEPLSVAAGLETIGFRASALDTKGCDRELMQFVYDHDLYEPSAPVVDELLAFLLETGTAIDRGFLVTRVYSLTGTAVKEDVEAEADLFVRTLLAATPVKLVDTTEAIAWLLGLETLEPERALAYLYALSDEVAIDDISLVADHAHQEVLLDRNLVECTSRNILDYFAASNFTVDEHLASLLQANPFPTGFTMVTAEERLGQESGFLKAVIASPDLTDDKVGEIADVYRAQFNRFDVAGISAERAGLLIDGGTIRATADNLRFVRENCPAAAMRFAIADPKAYLRLTLPGDDGESECGFSRDEALAIFAEPLVSDEVKAALLGQFDDRISLSLDYSDELNAAIAARHFDAADLNIVDELYLRGNRKLKRALAEAVAPQSTAVAERGLKLSIEMATDVAWRLRANPSEMVGFIASQLAKRDEAPSRLELRDLFERTSLREYVELIDGPSALIPDTPEDDALLAALGELGMAGKQVGKPDAHNLRRVNSKGYSRK